MPTIFQFRKSAVSNLTRQIGVYVLSDLDNVAIYVGQSKDGIRQRVQRHLTSARSDIIANRQIDIWEIAYVWSFPVDHKKDLDELENAIFHKFDCQSRLVNGKIPPFPSSDFVVPEPNEVVQVMSNDEIADKKSPAQRLPRQAAHYASIVGHFLSVKDSTEISRAMDAHFERLGKYHAQMLEIASED